MTGSFLLQTEVKTDESVFWRIILVSIQSGLNYFCVLSYVHPSTWPHLHSELLSVTTVTESNMHERTSDKRHQTKILCLTDSM